ncbi:MAG: hypothetical protein ABL936_12455 [Aestuariivirga sp.]
MSRSSSQTAQTSFLFAPVGAADKLWFFLKGMVRFEPAASAIYAENAKVRMSGRNWLM